MLESQFVKISCGDQMITVEKDVALMIRYVRDMFEDIDFSGDVIVPIGEISPAILNKVLDWCKAHKRDVPMTREEYMKVPLTKDEFDLLEGDLPFLYYVFRAAMYLGIEGLINTMDKMFYLVMGKTTPQEVRWIYYPEEKKNFLKLKTSDYFEIIVEKEVAFMSKYIKSAIESCDDSDIVTIHLKSIDSTTLNKILEWCKDHKGEVHEPKEDYVDIEWTFEDRRYLVVDATFLMKMLKAAYFLEIHGIVNIITQKIEDKLRNK